MAGFRKRVYGGSRVGGLKRRRVTRKFKRRSNRRGGGKSQGLTTQSGFGTSFGFKSKKWSRRRWNRALWNSTQQKSHYRTCWAGTNVLATPASVVSGSLYLLNADNNGAGQFWEAAGGAVEEDVGAGVGTFRGDIILRGATIGIIVSNVSDIIAQSIKFKIWLVKSGSLYTPGFLPASAPLGYDPTITADFSTRVGKIVATREFIVNNNEAAEFKYRLGIQKYDQYAAATAAANRWYWMLQVTNTTNASADGARATSYMNGSFTGDNVT